MRREIHDRADLIQQVSSDLSAWSTTGMAEIARRLSSHVSLALGGSLTGYSPSARTPDASTIGPAYAKWIAPELGLLATGATGWATQATLHVARSERTGVWLRGRYGSISPETPSQPLADTPTGERNRWSVIVGVTLGARQVSSAPGRKRAPAHSNVLKGGAHESGKSEEDARPWLCRRTDRASKPSKP